MCGIIGIIDNNKPVDRELLLRMRDTMTHRGPDDAGVWISPERNVGLGHRRLSIIDLSPLGHQPMQDDTGRYVITFNGEIYNFLDLRAELAAKGHQFKSRSDTEVLLESYKEWGEECVKRFNGMFSFALYDMPKKRIFLARDRAGEKPLYIWHSNGVLMFASEAKAIMAHPDFPRKLDHAALEWFLAYGYVPDSMSMVQGIRKLAPGHCLRYEVETGRVAAWQYWQLPEPQSGAAFDAQALADELGAMLLDSVKSRLIADVPVGVLLSGGIDSSMITAMAVKASSQKVKTFTVSFPGQGRYNEGPYAWMIAQHFGTEHIELETNRMDLDVLPDLVRQYDEPLADSSLIPTFLISQLISKYVKVALGGDGGDELFGGYPHHGWILRQEQIRKRIPPFLRPLALSASKRVLPLGFKGRNFVLGTFSGLKQNIAQINIFFDHLSRRQLLNGRDPSDLSPEQYKERQCIDGRSPLQMATSMDFQTYLPYDILTKVDRSSMLSSLEVRAPYLDYRIIEFVFGRIPDELRVTASERKVLIHRLAKPLLPPKFDMKRKQGFSVPLKEWFKKPWGIYCEEVLSEADPGLFNRNAIDRLIKEQKRGMAHEHRLFALMMFELWRRHYKAAV